jgi:hypothetical protein
LVQNSSRYEITVSAWEARMSLWIETPTIRDTSTGEVVMSFRDTNWSLNSARWLSDGVVELRMRKYPGSHMPAEVMATLDCSAKTARVGPDTMPIGDVEARLEQELVWPQAVAADPPDRLPGIFRRIIDMIRNGS